MEFKLDLGDAVQPLFAAVPGIAFSLGNTEVAFHVHADGAVHVMSAEVAHALVQCRTFRGLDQHVAAIVAANPALSEKRPAVRGVLEHLTKLGVLVPAREYITRLGRDDAREPAPTRALFVRASDGAERLAATLESAVAYARAHGATRRHVVVAPASDAVGAAITRARAEGLAVAQIDPARIGERLGTGDLGATNATLLLAAGARAIELDAGTRLEFRRNARAWERLALPRPARLPFELADGASDAADTGETTAGDVLAAAEAWCGRTLGAVIARGLVLDAAGVEGHALADPALDPGARVIGVDFATRGTPRGEDFAWPFNLRGEVRASLWRSRERYESQRRVPTLVSEPASVQALAGVASIPAIVDASTLLPPTPGDDAASERLFGAMLRMLHPDSIVLRATATLARDAAAPYDASQPYTPVLADLLVELAQGAAALIKSDDPAKRLERYAMIVRDLGEAPTRRRLEVLSGFVAHRRAACLAQLQDDLESSSGAPGWWTDALREAILTTGRPLTAHTTPRLAGWPDTLDEAGCTARLGEELVRYAARCEAWPALWARAAGIADELVAGT